eukprot:378707_1
MTSVFGVFFVIAPTQMNMNAMFGNNGNQMNMNVMNLFGMFMNGINAMFNNGKTNMNANNGQTNMNNELFNDFNQNIPSSKKQRGRKRFYTTVNHYVRYMMEIDRNKFITNQELIELNILPKEKASSVRLTIRKVLYHMTLTTKINVNW